MNGVVRFLLTLAAMTAIDYGMFGLEPTVGRLRRYCAVGGILCLAIVISSEYGSS